MAFTIGSTSIAVDYAYGYCTYKMTVDWGPKLKEYHKGIKRAVVDQLLVGNKVAIGISFRANNTNILVVNAHLFSGPENSERNKVSLLDGWAGTNLILPIQDYELIKGMKFANRKVFDHDYVFLAGDLNYRLDTCPLSNREMIQMCNRGTYGDLVQYDSVII
jgi:hypothetical protein